MARLVDAGPNIRGHTTICSAHSNVHDREEANGESVESNGFGQTTRQTLGRRSSFGCLWPDMLIRSFDYVAR